MKQYMKRLKTLKNDGIHQRQQLFGNMSVSRAPHQSNNNFHLLMSQWVNLGDASHRK